MMENVDNWYIVLRDPRDIWQKHASYLITEILFYFLALLTLIHALRNGGRYVYLWLTSLLHGLVVESLSYFVPDIDNFWHAQSMVMLLGQRLPLHIFFLYPVFIYTAAATVSRLKLSAVAEACTVGLCVVLIDIPFDIVGIKQLYWTWHDTDPNIFERHYSVPWTSYYFHASFAGAFTLLFHGTRALIGHRSDNRMAADGVLKESLCCLATGLLAMPVGILQFMPVYHPLHDTFHVHTQVCVLLFLAIYFLIAWSADRTLAKHAHCSGMCNELGLLVFVHFLAYIILSVTQRPENIRSVGLHQETGNCSHLTPVHTPTGQVLYKQTFLCVSAYDEPYFDFHCSPNVPADGLSWYEICGTPVANAVEFVTVVSALSLAGLYIFAQLLGYTSQPPRAGSCSARLKHD